jgi:hypothetical protein
MKQKQTNKYKNSRKQETSKTKQSETGSSK